MQFSRIGFFSFSPAVQLTHTPSWTSLPSKPPDEKAGFSPEATRQGRVTDQSAILLQVFYIP